MPVYIAIIYADGSPAMTYPLDESNNDAAISMARYKLATTARGTGYDLWHEGKRVSSFRMPKSPDDGKAA